LYFYCTFIILLFSFFFFLSLYFTFILLLSFNFTFYFTLFLILILLSILLLFYFYFTLFLLIFYFILASILILSSLFTDIFLEFLINISNRMERDVFLCTLQKLDLKALSLFMLKHKRYILKELDDQDCIVCLLCMFLVEIGSVVWGLPYLYLFEGNYIEKWYFGLTSCLWMFPRLHQNSFLLRKVCLVYCYYDLNVCNIV